MPRCRRGSRYGGVGPDDLSQPARLEHTPPGATLIGQVVGNVVYLADSNYGLTLLDVSDPATL